MHREKSIIEWNDQFAIGIHILRFANFTSNTLYVREQPCEPTICVLDHRGSEDRTQITSRVGPRMKGARTVQLNQWLYTGS
jgi:hypothetical protein